jgi:hypothetical protein
VRCGEGILLPAEPRAPQNLCVCENLVPGSLAAMFAADLPSLTACPESALLESTRRLENSPPPAARFTGPREFPQHYGAYPSGTKQGK